MQLVLPVSFSKHDDFSSFVAGDNQQLVSHIQNLLSESELKSVANQDRKQYARTSPSQRITLINGLQGAGKSHLLLATCELASQFEISHQYLQLKSMLHMPPQVLDGMGALDVLCIDGLDHVLGNREWQVGIFDLINQFIENDGKCLVFASRHKVREMAFELPDLATRLNWGTNFRLAPLNDEEKLIALANHAKAQGLNLQDDAFKFLLSRISRDMHKLVDVLQKLDKASLQDKRKITIPFIKSVLAI